MTDFGFRRNLRNTLHLWWMRISIALVVLLPFLLLSGLLIKSWSLVTSQSLVNLLFSSEWRPLQGHYGFLPFIVSSLWITGLSLLIAAPVCLLTSIYLTQYARKWVLRFIHPVVDILAGIPSVIYGVWGILIIIPVISEYIAPFLGEEVSGYSILAGGAVLAIMIIPFILNIQIEVLKTVPDELAESSLALGATRWQTVKYVVVKRALPGIISAYGLGLSRAFGETIAVLMVVGNVARIPKGALQPGYPLPALIANNYGEMMSIPMYDSALMFAALVLFVVVLAFNFISRSVIWKYEKTVR